MIHPRTGTTRLDEIRTRPADDTRGARRLPVFGSSSGASNADIRLSPIPPKWRDDTAPRLPLPNWHKRLVCSRCGSRAVDMVVSGEQR